MVTQDTSQCMNKKQGKVKRFLGNGIAELSLDIPAGAEKVTLYDQTDGSKLVVPRYSVDLHLRTPYTESVQNEDGTFTRHEDPSRRLFDWSPPKKIENSVTRPGETISKPKKRKRGKRGKR